MSPPMYSSMTSDSALGFFPLCTRVGIFLWIQIVWEKRFAFILDVFFLVGVGVCH